MMAAPGETTDSAERVRQRMFSDLLASERDLRAAAQRLLGEYRQTLLRLAERIAGEQVEVLRQADPQVFLRFSPQQWEELLLQGGSAHPWGEQARREFQRLQAELARARQQVQELQAANAEKSRTITRLQAELLQQAARQQARKSSESVPESQSPDSTGSKYWGAYSPWLATLAAWRSPKLPNRFAKLLDSDDLRQRRQLKALFLLAQSGFATRLEIDGLVGESEGLSNRPSSLRTALDRLAESGLATCETHKLERGGLKSALTYIRLASEGQALAQTLGWSVCRSDWEKLLEEHEGERFAEHSFAVLAFALHARMRGWQASICPDVQGPSRPDVLVENGAERWYVEVEIGSRDKPDKWRSLAQLQGKMAVCALSDADLATLMADGQHLGLSGLGTALAALVPVRFGEANPETPLWTCSW